MMNKIGIRGQIIADLVERQDYLSARIGYTVCQLSKPTAHQFFHIVRI